jgi:hypothetical protein
MIVGDLASTKLLFLPRGGDTFLCDLADKIAVSITDEEAPKSIWTQGLVRSRVFGRLATNQLHNVHETGTVLDDEAG